MAKFTLNSILSGFQSISLMNSNNDSIEDHFNNKVLYRDNPLGEANQMENNLDMNSNRILNLPTPVNDNEPARLVDLVGISIIDPTVITSVGTDNFTNESSIPGSTLTEVLNNINGAFESINSTLDNIVDWISDDFVRKTAQTSRSSTTTLAIDPHLEVDVEPGQTYFVECFLRAGNSTSVGAANFKFDVSAGTSSGPAAVSNSSLVSTLYNDSVSGSNTLVHSIDDPNFSSTGKSSDATTSGSIVSPGYEVAVKVTGMIEVSVSNDKIAVYWAQRTSNAAETILDEDCFLRLTKIAVPGTGIWDAPTNDLVYPIADPVTGGGAVITDATTARTLALTDTSAYIRFTSSSAVTVTVPPNTDEDFVIGAEVHLRQAGSGLVTVAAGAGVTVTAPFGGTLALAGTGATVTLKKVAANTWELFGQTASA